MMWSTTVGGHDMLWCLPSTSSCFPRIVSVAESEPAPESVTEPVTVPVTESVTVSVSEAVPVSDPVTESEPVPVPDPESVLEPVPVSDATPRRPATRSDPSRRPRDRYHRGRCTRHHSAAQHRSTRDRASVTSAPLA